MYKLMVFLFLVVSSNLFASYADAVVVVDSFKVEASTAKSGDYILTMTYKVTSQRDLKGELDYKLTVDVFNGLKKVTTINNVMQKSNVGATKTISVPFAVKGAVDVKALTIKTDIDNAASAAAKGKAPAAKK